MKGEVTEQGPRRVARSTRTERRAAERAQARSQARRKGSLSSATIIGGVMTIVAVLAILVFATVRSMGGSSAAGLADPKTLNPAPSLLPVKSRAPDFALRDTSGQSYTLSAQRGHPVLLEFFAVWCPVCQGEAPTVARITKEYVPHGVRVWSILANPYGPNYDLSGRSDLTLATDKDLAWYARTFNVRHPQLVDPQFNVVNRYGVNGYPGIYVVSPTGVITYASSGREPYTTLSAVLDKALKRR